MFWQKTFVISNAVMPEPPIGQKYLQGQCFGKTFVISNAVTPEPPVTAAEGQNYLQSSKNISFLCGHARATCRTNFFL